MTTGGASAPTGRGPSALSVINAWAAIASRDQLDHLEIGLGHAAVGAAPALGHVGPAGAGRDPVLGVAGRFVVDVAANDALPDFGFHSQLLSGVQFGFGIGWDAGSLKPPSARRGRAGRGSG